MGAGMEGEEKAVGQKENKIRKSGEKEEQRSGDAAAAANTLVRGEGAGE